MFKAVVFDMDGVLVDTEWAYGTLVEKYFTAHGIEVRREELNTLPGGSAKMSCELFERIWERGTGTHRPGFDIACEVFEPFENHTFDFRGIVFPGVIQTLETLKSRGFRLALASSSPKDNIQNVLNQCHFGDFFEFVVSGHDFLESKPDPAIYLYTLEQLGLDAASCIAVEDSDYGIIAAKRAGLTVVARRETRFAFTQAEADYIVDEIPELVDLLV